MEYGVQLTKKAPESKQEKQFEILLHKRTRLDAVTRVFQQFTLMLSFIYLNKHYFRRCQVKKICTRFYAK